jgi:hypothetical protein
LLACAILFSCTKETPLPEPPVQEAGTYTLTVEASKGERPDTKALMFVLENLNAFWKRGEEVSVYKDDTLLGTLAAQIDGEETTLQGKITGKIKKDDVLTLKFLSPDYASQDGSIEYISAHCDYAVANVTVTNVEGTSVTTTSAQFENQQAIVKFNLNVSARPLIVTLPKQTITVTPSSARDWLIVAVPAVSSASVFLKATAGEKTYMLNKTGITLEAGKYYNIDVTLSDAVVVHNEAELTAAITNDNAYILFANDISTTSLLEIKESRTISIDMNGFTLNRGCTSRDSQAIVVRTGSTLNLSNGTVTGGWGGHGGAFDIESGTHVNLTDVIITGNHADDRGGGISNHGTLNMTRGAITNNESYDHTDPAGGGGLFNYEGATATLTNVTFTGNAATVYGGGGICNYGTLYLDGVTIQNNTARSNGGGIWSGNKKDLLKIQGKNIITDNTASGVPSNLFMLERRLVTLTGSITGSRIGITLDKRPNMFTDGFPTYHKDEDPNEFFVCDSPVTDSLTVIQPEPYVGGVGEIKLVGKALKGKVPYLECSWDSENKKVVSTTKMLTEEIPLDASPTSETQYKKLKSSDSYMDLGTKDCELHEYYVAEGDELNIYALTIVGPNVHIILRDSTWLNLQNDIGVEKGNTVYFHAQSTGSFIGKLTAGGGIGGEIKEEGANIEIHGGNFDLQGTENCAAIGGQYETNGNITIYDGHIKATGGDYGAGIGSGYGCSNYGNITIYGGTIEATGNAGIGGGQECLNGSLTIWGGAITARGQIDGAGIGSNQFGGDYGAGTITINGGYIRAYGATHGAGIGGGDGKSGGTLIVNGGCVEAYGGTDAAGIGGGEGGNGGIVTINGGYVYAEGNNLGAGIGGGQDGVGADVTINGGTVIAKAGRDETGSRAIGPGNGEDENYGSLELGDIMMVSSERLAFEIERINMCWYRTQVRVEPCTHPGYTAETCPYHKH